MRSIHIIAPDRNERQLEAATICANHHLSSRLARRIRVRRRKQARLAQICRPNRHISIYLIRRDVYKPIHPMFPRSLQEHMRPVYVCVCELVRIAEAEVDVGLRREMEDGVDLMLA